VKYLKQFEKSLASTKDCYHLDRMCMCHSPLAKIEAAVCAQQPPMGFASAGEPHIVPLARQNMLLPLEAYIDYSI
jgi:hypothetical protein